MRNRRLFARRAAALRIVARSDSRERKSGLSKIAIVISTGMLLASVGTAVFNVWLFRWSNRRVDSAQFSVVNIPIRLGDPPGVARVQAVATNSGTNSFSITRVDWVLSELPDPLSPLQRLVRFSWVPDAPLLLEGGRMQVLDFVVPSDRPASDVQDAVGKHFFKELPQELDMQINFGLQLWNSIVVYLLDVRGDVHEVPIPVRQLEIGGSGGGQHHSFAVPVRGLPKKAVLLPSPVVEGEGLFLRQESVGGSFHEVGRDSLYVDNWVWRSENARRAAEPYLRNRQLRTPEPPPGATPDSSAHNN